VYIQNHSQAFTDELLNPVCCPLCNCPQDSDAQSKTAITLDLNIFTQKRENSKNTKNHSDYTTHAKPTDVNEKYVYLLTELPVDEVSSLAAVGVAPSALSVRDWPAAAVSPWRLSVAAMLLGGEERGSESEFESSESSSGQSSRAETLVCLPLGPITHVVLGFLRRDESSTLRVTSCTVTNTA